VNVKTKVKSVRGHINSNIADHTILHALTLPNFIVQLLA